jgi:glycosyltransferase involved in cell wall biosynthesis
MRIAMLDPSLFTPRYDDSLCAALAARGHDVTLVGRPMRHTDAIEPAGYQYVPRFFRWSEPLRERIGDGTAARIAKAVDYGLATVAAPLGPLRAGLVHVQWLPFAAADARLLARLAPRSALVHTVHNAEPFHGDRARAAARGTRDLLARFDALIAHGPETIAALRGQGLDERRMHIVPHPPMRLAAARPADLAAVPDPVAPRILFFGTIRPYKGLDLLVAACLDLWRRGHVFELAIAGKPFVDIDPMIARVRAEGFGHALIRDLGFLTESRLDAHLQKADILAFPYRAIDSSGAFLSALGYGAAMVTSDAGMFGGLPEDAVARVPAGDAGALADRLARLIADGPARKALGARALALGARMNGWAEAAAATEAVYEQALHAARKRGAG